MRDTGFAVRDVRRLAVPYIDGSPPRRMGDRDTVPFGEGAGIRFSPSRIFNPSSFASGGAGTAGTAAGFLRFLEMVRLGGGKVLSKESTRSMMSNQIGALRIDVEETPSWGFGFGGAVLVDPVRDAVDPLFRSSPYRIAPAALRALARQNCARARPGSGALMSER